MESRENLREARTSISAQRTGSEAAQRDSNLRDQVNILEENPRSINQSDGSLRNRFAELQRSERTQLSQLASVAQPRRPSMHHTQRLDQRLHTLRDEVRIVSQEKERGERVWRERLQRCQTQLRAKEEEMGRQAQYFHHYKTTLQLRLRQARDREQALQGRTHALERQLLDATVAAMTTRSVAAPPGPGEDRVPSLREQGEGEEGGERIQKKEEEEEEERWTRRNGWPARMGRPLAGGDGGTKEEREGRSEVEVEEEARGAGEAKLRSFILGLQEDLRALLEGKEQGVAERRALQEQLQEAQESGHLLGCRLEEKGVEVHRLQQSEGALLEEVEELREENVRLRRALGEAGSGCWTAGGPPDSPGPGGPPSPAGGSLPGPPDAPDPEQRSTCTSWLGDSGAAESTLNPKDLQPAPDDPDASPGPQGDPQSLSASLDLPIAPPGLRTRLPPSSTAEELGRLDLEDWCSGGSLHPEAGPSREADALLEAYRSLGMGAGHGDLHEEQVGEEELPAPPGDALVQALNQENRALARRIQELLEHVSRREEEHAGEAGRLAARVAALAADAGRRERQRQEQGFLITELTRKTEDDLNAIMDLRQRLSAREQSDGTCACRRDDAGPTPPPAQEVDPRGATAGSAGRRERRPPQRDEPPENGRDLSVSTATSAAPPPSHLPPLPHPHLRDVRPEEQALRDEKEELLRLLGPLRQERSEVVLAVRTQSEERQRLTRSLWLMKEERDGVAAALDTLRLEREQLSRTVCGLREERDLLGRSLEGLRVERDQLGAEVSELRNRRGTTSEPALGGEGERVQVTVQSDPDLTPDHGGLTGSSGGLTEQRDPGGSHDASQEERDDLLKLVCGLKEERQRVEQSITDLKLEEEQVMLSIWNLKEERDILQAEADDQSQSGGRSQEEHLANQMAKETEKGNLEFRDIISQERLDTNPHQSDLMRQTEGLGVALNTTREELVKAQSETQRLSAELFASVARLEEMEKTAVQADREKRRLTCLLDDARLETDLLTAQVKELQNRLAVLAREKDEAVTLKTSMEEQFSVLQAQLRAKSVALDELNLEYTALRREQGSLGGSSPDLGSLRARYNDIRAKYDALLRKKSQTDLDVAPVKAKLSCLVLKCQERNSVLLLMMRAMRRGGCVEHALTQQAEDLLGDPALQDYTTAFAPAASSLDLHHQHHLHSGRFSRGLASRLQYHSGASAPDTSFSSSCSSSSTPPTELQRPGHQKAFPPVPSGSDDLGTLAEPGREVPNATGWASTRSGKVPGPLSTVHEHAEAPPPSPPVTHLEEEDTCCSSGVGSKPQSPSVPSGTRQAGASRHRLNHDDANAGGRSTSGPPRSPRAPHLRWAPPPTERQSGPTRRLSSPEKILSLQLELQQTLSSMYKAPSDHGGPAERGRRPQPRRTASLPASPEHLQGVRASSAPPPPPPHPPPQGGVGPIQREKPPPASPPPTARPSTTLCAAVFARSANMAVPFGPGPGSKAPGRSGSFARVSADGDPDLRGSVVNTPESAPGETRHALPWTHRDHRADLSTAAGSPAQTSSVLPFTGGAPNTTATDDNNNNNNNDNENDNNTAPGVPQTPCREGQPAAPDDAALGGANRRASITTARCDHRSASPAGRPAARLPAKPQRPKPGAPGEVSTVEVIRAVGGSSLLIGWERPPLDELGCSNGTFVYGYRVYVDGEFHKSVMSSACTKCILQNLDLGLPVHIGVQTLGSNGLGSASVTTTYRPPPGAQGPGC